VKLETIASDPRNRRPISLGTTLTPVRSQIIVDLGGNGFTNEVEAPKTSVNVGWRIQTKLKFIDPAGWSMGATSPGCC
jgi:hypothetical protein